MEAAISKDAYINYCYQPSPIHYHFTPRPPSTVPSDLCTTYESVLTTPTATPSHRTNLSHGVKIVVSDVEGCTINAKGTAEDASFA